MTCNFLTPLLHWVHNKGHKILIVGMIPPLSIEKPWPRGEGTPPTQVVWPGESSSYDGVAGGDNNHDIKEMHVF